LVIGLVLLVPITIAWPPALLIGIGFGALFAFGKWAAKRNKEIEEHATNVAEQPPSLQLHHQQEQEDDLTFLFGPTMRPTYEPGMEFTDVLVIPRGSTASAKPISARFIPRYTKEGFFILNYEESRHSEYVANQAKFFIPVSVFWRQYKPAASRYFVPDVRMIPKGVDPLSLGLYTMVHSAEHLREPNFRTSLRETGVTGRTTSATNEGESNQFQLDSPWTQSSDQAPSGPSYAISEIQKMIDLVNHCITETPRSGETANQTDVAYEQWAAPRPSEVSKDLNAPLNSSSNPHTPEKTLEFPAVTEPTIVPKSITSPRVNGIPPVVGQGRKSTPSEIPPVRLPPVIGQTCPSCKSAIAAGNQFCGKCGARV
jgi:hypothetical protein